MNNIEFDRECRRQNVLEYLCINNPQCPCGERDWRCLGRWNKLCPDGTGSFVIECRKCQYKRKGKIKQVKKSKFNSGAYHACTGCGDDQCYLEDNHMYCFGGKEICIYLCANCHAIVTEDQKSHGKFPKQAATEHEAIGLFILNVGDLAKLMAARQRNFVIIADLLMMLIKEGTIFGTRLVGQQINLRPI